MPQALRGEHVRILGSNEMNAYQTGIAVVMSFLCAAGLSFGFIVLLAKLLSKR